MTRLLKKFWHDTQAAVALESLIIFPLLMWTWVGTFIFFDAYRVYNSSIKATYSVADLLSRQTVEQDQGDIDGMAAILQAMIRDTQGVRVRVTQILRNADGDYVEAGGYATGGLATYSTANIAAMVDQLPDIDLGEYIILVESFIDYDPAFDVGLNDLEFENFAIVRPRWGRLPMASDDTSSNAGNVEGSGV